MSAETTASDYLEGAGYTIVKRNFHYGKYGEIDIIAQKGSQLLFVEVRSRNTSRYGDAFSSIRPSKVNKLRRCARYFLVQYPDIAATSDECRFDLIAIDNNRLIWHEDIIR